MKNKNSIEDKDLDGFLNNLFLNENSELEDEALAKFVFDQEYNIKIDSQKEKRLLKRLSNNKGGGRWKFYLLLLITALGIYVFYKTNEKNNNDPHETLQTENVINQGLTFYEEKQPGVYTAVCIDSLVNMAMKDSGLGSVSLHIMDIRSGTGSLNDNFSQSTGEPVTIEDGVPVSVPFIPVEETYKKFAVIKTKMMEKLLNVNMSLYSQIEEGQIEYKNTTVEIDPFIIRNQAITNLEYKVFLADLFKNNRIEEYKKAAVHSDAWNNYGCSTLADNYFFDNAYNSFPVVNISTEAAQLFCSWLEKEVNSMLHQKDAKAPDIKIRLPYDSEWIFATRRGYAQIPDCDGYNTIYDKLAGIVDNTYLKRIRLIKKRNRKDNTEIDELFATNRYGMPEQQMLQLFERGKSSNSKLKDSSLYIENIDVYSKVAHVSEIINEYGTANTTIIGSCWKSKEEYLQMVAEFNKAAASPFVGFRIVMLNGNKASYKSPFW